MSLTIQGTCQTCVVVQATNYRNIDVHRALWEMYCCRSRVCCVFGVSLTWMLQQNLSMCTATGVQLPLLSFVCNQHACRSVHNNFCLVSFPETSAIFTVLFIFIVVASLVPGVTFLLLFLPLQDQKPCAMHVACV